MTLKYRSEIDGLRALTILPVVFFHAGFDLFSGGYIGVDVFFVISGYLITNLILKELNNNTFSLLDFYERRARRILPALYLIIFVITILSYFFLTRSEISEYFKSVISTVLFSSNIYFWKSSPYFDANSDLQPLLHTWSLSIEEQFYIFFPILLILVFKYFKKYTLIFFSICFLLSLFLCQFLALKTGNNLNFYFTLSRAWELALGAITAYYINKNKKNLPETFNNFLSLVGLSLILLSIFFFDKYTLHPSIFTFCPAIGTVLIIIFTKKKSFIEKILSNKILVSIGLVSYSLYLWHQPLLVFGRIYFDNFLLEHKIFILTLSLLLAYLSFNFIEKLFRNRSKISFKSLFRILFLSLLILLIFSLININNFNSNSKNSTEAKLAKLLLSNRAVYAPKMDGRQFIKFRIFYENLNPNTLVIGSSRVMQISNNIYDKKLINLAVGGGSIEDYIVIAEMGLEKFNSKKILLGADPWLFNKYQGQKRWKSLIKEYSLSLENIQSSSIKNSMIDISSSNNESKLLEYIYNRLNIRKAIPISENIKNNKQDIILRDGSRVYAKKNKIKKIKPAIINYSMETYEFSEKKYELYIQFINYLKNVRNVDVVLVLTPYHPDAYKLTIKEKPIYIELEKKYREIAKQFNIKIVGSYNSTLTGCNKHEFYDLTHPKESCMKKIIKDIN